MLKFQTLTREILNTRDIFQQLKTYFFLTLMTSTRLELTLPLNWN